MVAPPRFGSPIRLSRLCGKAMESSLHKQLKERYAGAAAQIEVPFGPYRIDVVHKDRLIEIQHGSLAAIRDKIAALVADHRIVVVKPIVHSKQLVKKSRRGGAVVGRRMSPKRGSILDLFDELVHFTRVYPHPNLELHVPLVDIEEWRYPGHGKRRRRRASDHQIEDQVLVGVRKTYRFRDAEDLVRLLPPDLPELFHTGDLAERLKIPRWSAQRIAYCLRKMGAALQTGKQGNTRLYRIGA